MEPFQPAREDGRADWRVVFDLTKDAAPETLFDYDTIRAALEEGIDGEVSREKIGRAARAANVKLLKLENRSLAVVAGRGYRIRRADEHLPAALDHKSRADHQIKAGLQLIEQVRMDELTEAQRGLHVGTGMILSGFYRMMKAADSRQKRHELLLSEIRTQQNELAERLARVEAATT